MLVIFCLLNRRMFPSMRISLSGLENDQNYCVLLEMVPVADCRFKFSGSQWVPAGGNFFSLLIPLVSKLNCSIVIILFLNYQVLSLKAFKISIFTQTVLLWVLTGKHSRSTSTKQSLQITLWTAMDM